MTAAAAFGYYFPVPIFPPLLCPKGESTDFSESELNDEEEDFASAPVNFFCPILAKSEGAFEALGLGLSLLSGFAAPLPEPLAEPFGFCKKAPSITPLIYKL